jgi:hypothetical protein
MSNGIGKNPLIDISKVYVQQVVEKKKDDTYLEPDMKKRQSNNEKARKELAKGPQMKNPHFESVEKSGWDAIKACSDGYKEVYKEEEVEVAEADSLAAMQARREKRLAAQRKREGTTATGRDFGHDYSLSADQQKKRRSAEFKAGTKKEEYVTELSKKTLGSYVKKASSDAADRSFDHGESEKRQYEPDAYDEKETSKLANRQKGIKRAVNRLTKEGLDPVGKEDGDVNNDGKKDSTDSYLMKRRKAIGNSMKKKMSEAKVEVPDSDVKKLSAKAMKRVDADVDGDVDTDDMKSNEMGEFIPSADGKKKVKTKVRFEAYSWRSELSEVITDIESEKEIKEKKVKNTVKINPTLGEAVEEIGGTILEAIEVDEMEIVVEEVYAELIEEGYSEDDVEDAIEYSLNEVSESYLSTYGYNDKAVKTSNEKSNASEEPTSKKSMKDRLKSAAKKAIMGTSRAAGRAMKAKASVQAAPGRAKEKVKSLADRVKSVAKSGYESGRGPVEKKSTTYRGAGSGRKEKIGEGNQGGENIQEIDVKGALDSGARMMNSNPVGKVIKKVLSPAGSGRGTARPAPSARPGTTGGGATSRPMMNSYEPKGDLVDENVATGKAKRAKMGGIAQKVGAGEIVSNKEKDAAMAKKKSANDASDKAVGDAAHKAATDKGMSPSEAMMRKRAAERKAARERAREMK